LRKPRLKKVAGAPGKKARSGSKAAQKDKAASKKTINKTKQQTSPGRGTSSQEANLRTGTWLARHPHHHPSSEDHGEGW
jgi:hypothetical protein